MNIPYQIFQHIQLNSTVINMTLQKNREGRLTGQLEQKQQQQQQTKIIILSLSLSLSVNDHEQWQ